MIEILSGLPDNVVGFTAKGRVTGNDYEQLLVPAVEKKLKDHEKISLLYCLGEDFEGFDAAAMWDDAKIGLQHMGDWDRIAVVSDSGWVREATKVFGFAMPGKVQVFKNDQMSQAREWVSE